MISKPKISIITVTFNAEKLLPITLDSIKNQTYTNIESVVIDGESKDGTVDIIKQNLGVVNQWVSEKDNGLYDAMNKGLNIMTGDYVLFLNAGDTFYENDTLDKIFSNKEADIYYGETVMVDDNRNIVGGRRLKTPKYLNWKSFKWGMVVCHQSVIIKKDIMELYDLSYKIASDYDWVLMALKKAKIITNTNQIISCFLEGGLSRKNIKIANIERFKSMRKHYGLSQALFYNFLMLFRLTFTYIKLGRL